jgi:hypothetical protein
VYIATLVVGVAVVAAISLSPLYAHRVRLTRSTPLGLGLVFAATGLASLAVSRDVPPADEAFLGAFVLLLLGALLMLRDDPDDHRESDDDEPPWWPEFEADFRRYERRRHPLRR